METMKQSETVRRTAGIIAIAIIAIIALAIIGCKGDDDTTTGGTQEQPQKQPVDYITDNAGNKIPIYKTDGVSDADATTAANNIKAAFNAPAVKSSYRNILSIGIKKIYLLEGDSLDLYSFDKATGILKVGSGWTDSDTYANCFIYAVYPALTKYTLSFGTAENPCAVTVTSDDQFTADEWLTLCDKVVAAIEREYARDNNNVNQIRFRGRFASTANTSVVLLPNSATWMCEVKEGNDHTIYIKISAIDTVDLQKAVEALSQTKTYQG